MARVLIALKFALLRNSPRGMRLLGWVLGALLLAGTWAAVLVAEPAVALEVAMAVQAPWLIGAALGPMTVSGSGVLRADLFALLPLPRRRLALSLVASSLVGVGSLYVLLANLALVVPAARVGPSAARRQSSCCCWDGPMLWAGPEGSVPGGRCRWDC